MNNIKIIASDYDGTLSYKGVSQDDIAAIEKFRNLGNKFGIVTGRDVNGVTDFLKLPIDFIICNTGAVIINGTGELLYQKTGSFGEYIKSVYEYAKNLGCLYFIYSYKTERSDLKNIIDSFQGKLFEQCNTRFETEEKATMFCNYINQNFCNSISAVRNESSVDMPPAGVSKTTGILEYAKHIPNPIIYTIGDNINDIDMIKAFNGIAVSNAKEEVKKHAKYQANRVADAIEFVIND